MAGAWLPPAAVALGIFTVSSLPGRRVPGLIALPGADKLAHGLAYALLGASLARALHRSSPAERSGAAADEPALRTGPRSGRIWLTAVLAAGLYGVSDEVHQLFVPGRSSELTDLAADLAGAAAGAALFLGRAARVGRRPRGEQAGEQAGGREDVGGPPAQS